MKRRSFAVVGCSLTLLGVGLIVAATASTNSPRLVASYTFELAAGGLVHDASSFHNDGVIVGPASFRPSKSHRGLWLDGTSFVRIPNSKSLNLNHEVTIVVTLNAGPSSMNSGIIQNPRAATDLWLRPPSFQVAGDRLYLVSNSDYDVYDSKGGLRELHSTLFTGSIDSNLISHARLVSRFKDIDALEPKLQVVGNKIYYEFFGRPRSILNKTAFVGSWHIYTARSELNGSSIVVWRRTEDHSGYVVEQDLGIQAAGDRIYYAYPKKDMHKKWQLWTAISGKDETQFVAKQRTVGGGWIPRIRVAGDYVYYAFTAGPLRPLSPTSHKSLCFAKSRLDGNAWQVLHCIQHAGAYVTHNFVISGGRVYSMYAKFDRSRELEIFTGQMRTDGSGFQERQRTVGPTLRAALFGGFLGMQKIGRKLYYTFLLRSSREPSKFKQTEQQWNRWHDAIYCAESSLDGTGWSMRRVQFSNMNVLNGYMPLQIVGGKMYLGAALLKPGLRMVPVIGSLGANLINKGDSYGIGLTSESRARAFVNAGSDYLYRGEAPSAPGGSAADAVLSKGPHTIVMTYDRERLALYIDGHGASIERYNGPIAENPFPLQIGDGFRGLIKSVRIYDGVLTAPQIRALH